MIGRNNKHMGFNEGIADTQQLIVVVMYIKQEDSGGR